MWKKYIKRKREKKHLWLYIVAPFFSMPLGDIWKQRSAQKTNKNTYNVNACLTDVRVSFKCVKVDMKGSR